MSVFGPSKEKQCTAPSLRRSEPGLCWGLLQGCRPPQSTRPGPGSAGNTTLDQEQPHSWFWKGL